MYPNVSGSDGIPPDIPKVGADELSSVLSVFSTRSLSTDVYMATGHVPVTPIHIQGR